MIILNLNYEQTITSFDVSSSNRYFILNSIHQSNSLDKGAHSLMIKNKISTQTSNGGI